MDNGLWRTDDLALATFLALHLDLERMEWGDDNRCYWFFDKTEELEDYVVEWQFGEPIVNARDYAETNARLKRQMFDESRT